jgi:hypothetical protein
MKTQDQDMDIEAYVKRRINRNPTIAAIYARANPVDRQFNVNLRLKVLACWNYCVERSWKVEYICIDQQEQVDKIAKLDFENIIRAAERGIFDAIVYCSHDKFNGFLSFSPHKRKSYYKKLGQDI